MEKKGKKTKCDGLVTKTYLQKVIKKATQCHYYLSGDDQDHLTMGRMCVTLFERDYVCNVRRNRFGRLCPGYPGFIVIPLKEKAIGAPTPSPESRLSNFDGKEWSGEVKESRLVRRKMRFPLPVILCQGKYVCRSATLQSKVTKAWNQTFGKGKWLTFSDYQMNINTAVYILMSIKFQEEMKRDVKLLKDFGVGYICDLRHQCEITKSNENASGPENHYLHLYEEFKTVHLPYPGRYYFREFRENTNVEDLVFDWNWVFFHCFPLVKWIQELKNGSTRIKSKQSGKRTVVQLPVDVKIPGMDITKFKTWKALELTQNYLLYLLTYLTSGEKGILVNSYCGLDRTPLFVCLLRLSLWADGLIHQSLSPLEMTFLTVSYDWHLCGHNLPERIFDTYLIMLFCFKCLRHISSDRFSMKKVCDQSSQGETNGSNSATSEREEKLVAVQEIFLELYYARLEEMRAHIKQREVKLKEFAKLLREQRESFM